MSLKPFLASAKSGYLIGQLVSTIGRLFLK
ncbi:hypothetical protein CSPX01_13183 [Colletotrichum filicis]|nr:hypothetical protein CSPX01_13183 [Colletotrichum filicis]